MKQLVAGLVLTHSIYRDDASVSSEDCVLIGSREVILPFSRTRYQVEVILWFRGGMQCKRCIQALELDNL